MPNSINSLAAKLPRGKPQGGVATQYIGLLGPSLVTCSVINSGLEYDCEAICASISDREDRGAKIHEIGPGISLALALVIRT